MLNEAVMSWNSKQQLLVCLFWLGGQLFHIVYSQGVNDIRLVNGASYIEGLVEVLFNNAIEWEPLCDIGLDSKTANLICQRLGFSNQGAESYLQPVSCIFGHELQCDGSSTVLELDDCVFKEHRCTELYGVRCTEDVTVSLNNESLVNNSLISINEEEDGGQTNLTSSWSLVCQTTYTPCCLNASMGAWYTPSGMEVPFTMETAGLYATRGDNGTVRLINQLADIDGGVDTPSGMYHCEIPDSDNTTRFIYVGIYNNTGHVVVTDLVYDVSTQTLICTSTDGPATTVTWFKDDIILTIDSRMYEQAQVITNTTSATYENKLKILSITEATAGVYECMVGNSISNSTSPSRVPVFVDGETRLVGADSQDPMIEVYFNGDWQTVCSNLFIEGDIELLLQNMNIVVDGISITTSWDQGLEEVSYEVICSNTENQGIRQEHRVIVPPVNINSVTINNLLPLTTYNCCVTAYQNTNTLLNNKVTVCQTTSTMTYVSTQTTASVEATMSTPESLSCGYSSSVVVIPLSAVIGILILLLVVLTTVLVCVAVKKRNKAEFKIPNTYESQEVHLRNPIYTSSNENETTARTDNKELEYSTIDSPSTHSTSRNAQSSSSTPDSNRYSLRQSGIDHPAATEMYETIPTVHKSQTDLVTSAEHPKRSYPVRENTARDRPRSELTASVIAYEVVDLVSSSVSSEKGLSLENTEHSTVRNSPLLEVARQSSTPPAGRSINEGSGTAAVPVEYSIPIDSPRFSRGVNTTKPTQATPRSRQHQNDNDTSNAATPQPYETVK